MTDEGKPLAAEVTLYDYRGNPVQKTNSAPDSHYEMKPKITEGINYILTFTADNLFVASEIINTAKPKDSGNFLNIKTVLPKLKKGSKYKMGNLIFFADSPQLIARSLPSLASLYHLMKKNKNLKIKIEGHVNGIGSDDTFYKQLLSHQRTETVYKYLTRY